MNHSAEGRRVTQLLFFGAVILLASLLYRIVSPFLVQIGWAAVLAICVHPWNSRLARRFGPNRGALLSTLIITLLLVVPAVAVGMAVASEGTRVVHDVQEAVDRGTVADKVRPAWDWARAHLPLPPVEELRDRFGGAIAGLAGGAAARAGGLLKNVAGFILDLALTLFILFFLLRDAHAIGRSIPRILPFDEDQRQRLIELTRDLVSASVTASLAIAALQGLLGGVLFAILGIPAPVLWGSVMGFASLIPLVGTSLIWAPAAAYLLLSGEVARGLILVAVAVVLISNVDNVIRPMLLKGKSQMPTLVTFLSLMGGVSAFGFIGLVLGPLVVAMALALLESYLPPSELPAERSEAPLPAPAPAPEKT